MPEDGSDAVLDAPGAAAERGGHGRYTRRPAPAEVQELPKKRPRAVRGGEDLETLTLTLKVVTTMLGGGAVTRQVDRCTPIRPSAIRGHLRWWWRLTPEAWDLRGEPAELYGLERKIWGGPADDNRTGGRSPVEISVRVEGAQQDISEVGPRTPGFYALWVAQASSDGDVPVAERWKPGMTLILSCRYPKALETSIQAALRLWIAFGGVGGRTRRGLGALAPADERADALVGHLADLHELLPHGTRLALNPVPTPPPEPGPEPAAPSRPPDYMAPRDLSVGTAPMMNAIKQNRELWPAQLSDLQDAAARRLQQAPQQLYEYNQRAKARQAAREQWEQNQSHRDAPHAASSFTTTSGLTDDCGERWRMALGWLQDFRQGAGDDASQHARNPAPRGENSNRPGRTRWPEADKIRRLTGQNASEHPPLHNSEPAWPRAGFGLPIQFRFQQKDRGRQDYRPPEPEGVFILDKGSDLERWASRLIVKPVVFKGQSVAALALKLPLEVPDIEISLRRQGNATGSLAANSVPIRRLQAAGDKNKFGPIANPQSDADIVDIFLAWIEQFGHGKIWSAQRPGGAP